MFKNITAFHIVALSWIPILIFLIFMSTKAPNDDYVDYDLRFEAIESSIIELERANTDIAKVTRQNLLDIKKVKEKLNV